LSAYEVPLSFPGETPHDQHGHLKNEMADRVVDKISRYAQTSGTSRSGTSILRRAT
jgi:putative lipoic acid-binding regulatory protein